MSYVYEFVVKGTALTGTAKGPQGESPLTEGKVDGDAVTFVEMMDGTIRVTYTGKINLDDPVSTFVPELANMRVVPEAGTPEPAKPITIRHLLTHSSGLDGVRGRGPGGPPPGPRGALAVEIPKMAQSPLAWQPGARWAYSPGQGFDLLGRVVEIVSGDTLDRFLKRRILDPLGMKDTAFVLTDAQTARLVTLYESRDGQLTARPSGGF